MCKTFDVLLSQYLTAAQAGWAAFRDRERTPWKLRNEPAYHAACAAEHAANVMVGEAREAIEQHKHTCKACCWMLTICTVGRARVDDVDPREFEQPPMIEMWEAR